MNQQIEAVGSFTERQLLIMNLGFFLGHGQRIPYSSVLSVIVNIDDVMSYFIKAPIQLIVLTCNGFHLLGCYLAGKVGWVMNNKMLDCRRKQI